MPIVVPAHHLFNGDFNEESARLTEAEIKDLSDAELEDLSGLIWLVLPKEIKSVSVKLPGRATYLNISSHTELAPIPGEFLPENLVRLVVGQRGLEAIAGPLPSNVKAIGLYKYPHDSIDAVLLTSMQFVSLKGSNISSIIGKFDNSLRVLDLSDCEELETLKAQTLPDSLEELDISDSGINEIIGQLPDSIKKLKLSNLEIIEHFPTNLEEVDLSESGISSIPQKLPDSVTYLNLNESFRLRVVEAEKLSQNLAQLTINQSVITRFEGKLPGSLKILSARSCSYFSSLDATLLPDGLEKLDFEDTSIATITGKFPKSLTSLKLPEFAEISLLSKIIDQLFDLDERGCEIYFEGEKFNEFISAFRPLVRKADSFIDEAIAQLPSNLENDFPSTRLLLRRFYIESDEDDLDFLQKTLADIFQLIRENPKSLIWIEKIAETSLDACINQPMIGLTQISAWVELAKKKTMLNKVEYAGRLMAQDAVVSYIANLPQDKKPTKNYEAESGNVMLREVHNKFLENGDIDNPWNGIPENVQYEENVALWLTEDKIEDTYNAAKIALKSDVEKCAKYLYASNAKYIWREIALGDSLEMEELEFIFAAKKEILANIGEIQSLDGEEKTAEMQTVRNFLEDRKFSPAQRNILTNYAQNLMEKSMEELAVEYDSLNSEKEFQLDEMCERLTRQALQHMHFTPNPETGDAHIEKFSQAINKGTDIIY